MKLPGFIYGSNESQSWVADQERTINLYPEVPQGGGRASLLSTPGVKTITTVSTSPGRGHFFQDGREWAVIGNTLYEVYVDGTTTSRGTVAVDKNPATICSNGDGGDQLFITSGGNGYYYDLTANTLNQISALDGKATMGAYLDGFFIAFDANSSTVYTSAVLDGSSWTTGVDFAQRSVGSDPWVSMRVLGRYVYLLGQQTSEVWFNSGDTFPLAFYPSGLIRYGCTAPFSAAVVDDALYWLGQSEWGRGVVLRAGGTDAEVVSSLAVQAKFNQIAEHDDAIAFGYSDFGHNFYVLSFQNAETTWALDTAMGRDGWAERGTWISERSQYTVWRPAWHVLAFGEHRILDHSTGDIYRMRYDYLTDVDGRGIRRLRRPPTMIVEDQRLFPSSLEVDLEAGQDTIFQDITTTLLPSFTWTVPGNDPSVSFDPSASVGDIASYYWDFGDGESSTDGNPSHLYASFADYTVTLTITDNNGITNSVSTIVTVAQESSGDVTGSYVTRDTRGGGARIMMRYSKDGGKNWSQEFWRDAGALGEYGKRVRWERLGTARRLTFEFIMTDEISWKLIDAYINFRQAPQGG